MKISIKLLNYIGKHALFIALLTFSQHEAKAMC